MKLDKFLFYLGTPIRLVMFSIGVPLMVTGAMVFNAPYRFGLVGEIKDFYNDFIIFQG